MIEIVQKSPDMERELQFIHISLEMQERKMDEIHQMLKDDQRRTTGEANPQPGDGDP